jgi:hypothetical protein
MKYFLPKFVCVNIVNKKFWEKTNRLPTLTQNDSIENDASKNYSLPRKRVNRAIVLQRYENSNTDTQTDKRGL